MLAPLASSYSFLQYQKKQVRKEIKHALIAGIAKEDLVLLKFTQEEKESKLKWKHEREFEFEEHMYDIVETELHDDTTYYWCWSDHEETALNQGLKELVNLALGNHAPTKKCKQGLAQLYKQLVCEKPVYFNGQLSLKKLHPAYSQLQLNSFSFPPPSPPPQLA